MYITEVCCCPYQLRMSVSFFFCCFTKMPQIDEFCNIFFLDEPNFVFVTWFQASYTCPDAGDG